MIRTLMTLLLLTCMVLGAFFAGVLHGMETERADQNARRYNRTTVAEDFRR